MRDTDKGSRAKVPIAVVILVAAAVVLGLTVGAFAWSRSGTHGPATTASAPSASWMQDACEQWMGGYSGATPPASWCASMWSWMQSSGPGMMGMMWWDNADQFRSACVNRAEATPDSKAWCDAMTTWMQHRASQYGGWGPWMMRPSP